MTYNVFREQIEALIAISDVCEQEIKFEVPCKLDSFSYNYFTVQVGPSEECCIWSEVWMVDEPT